MNEILALLGKAFDLYAEHKVPVVIASMYIIVPVLDYMATQRVKRTFPMFAKRRMKDHEVIVTSYVFSVLLTSLMFFSLIPEVSWRVQLINQVIIAISLERLISFIMRWAKKHRPELYRVLRNDRRQQNVKTDKLKREFDPVDIEDDTHLGDTVFTQYKPTDEDDTPTSG